MFFDSISVHTPNKKRLTHVKDKISLIGLRLRELRRAKNLSQQNISAQLGLAKQSAYQKYESGAVTPPPDKLAKLAELFGVTTDYLLGREKGFTVEETLTQYQEPGDLDAMGSKLAYHEIMHVITGKPRKLAEFRKVLEDFRRKL